MKLMISKVLKISAILFGLCVWKIANADALYCTNLSPTVFDKPFTLVELTDLALECNPTTHEAWAQLKIALANLGIAYSTYWPQINGTVSAVYINNKTRFDRTISANGQSIDVVTQSDREKHLVYGPEVTLSYLIWDFGSRHQQAKSAQFQVDAAEFSRNAAFQQVMLQVEQAYYEVLGNQALVAASEKSVQENQINLASARALHQHGLAVIGDVYQAQSALEQAKLLLQQNFANFKIAQGQLATSVGVPILSPIKLTNIPSTIETTSILHTLLGSMLEFARLNRPDLLAAQAQVESAQADVKAAQAQQWPTITIDANSRQIFPRQVSGGGEFNTVTLSLNIPIFTGFAQTYAVKLAEGQEHLSEAQRDALANQVDFQVWEAYFTLQTAGKAINTSKALLLTSQQAAKQALGQYRAGVGTILNLLSTQSTLASARTQLIQAKLDWYVSLAQLYAALGSLDIRNSCMRKRYE